MVRLRSDGALTLPPPMYHPESTSVTVTLYYNGEIEGNAYVGGKVRKIDYVDVEKFTFLCLDEYLQDLFTCGSVIKVFTAVNNGVKKICKDEDLKKYGRKYMKKHREYPLFIEKSEQEAETSVEDELNVTVTRDQAYRAKQAALQIIQGDPDLQYSKLWDYAEEVRKTNSGSTVILGTDDVSGELRFGKFYVCLDAVKKGFKSCRPFIGVDGCHLKGPHGGVLLTAVGVDPDNSNFPIAYAVVSSETKDNWSWFFTVLKSDLGLQNGEGVTFVSDKQKGLIFALPEVFPAAEQRFCVRHMVVNMQSAGHKGVSCSNAVWKAAKTTTVGEFKLAMRFLRTQFPEAAHWLRDKHPREWSKSHFLEYSRCDLLLNNTCESFNSSILPARDKPIITMLEWIREYLMKTFQKNREAAEHWDGMICPTIAKIIERHGKKVGGCRPVKASRSHFQIQCNNGTQFAVDLDSRTCSCRKWQLTGIPCKHSLSAIYNEKLDVEDFVASCYHVSTYKRVYADVVMPLSSNQLWGNTLFIPPLPPNFGRRPGRPAKLRRRSVGELERKGKSKRKKGPIIRKLRRFQKTIHCGHCGQPGHNALFCPDLPDTAKAKLERIKRKAFEEAGESYDAFVEGDADAMEAALNTAAEDETTHDILPPLTQEAINEEQRLNNEQVQESQEVFNDMPDYTLLDEPSTQGPSMFDQLKMGNPEMINAAGKKTMTVEELSQKGRATAATRRNKALGLRPVKLRVPPTMKEQDLQLSQHSITGPMTNKTIVVKGGKKFLELSRSTNK